MADPTDTDDELEGIADELYALAPEDFIAARTASAKEAKDAGERALAAAVTALRKPTQAAWLANLLAQERPDELAALLELGTSMRDSLTTLPGPELKQVLLQRRQVVTALVREARRLALDRGHRVADAVAWEVEATLEAAFADEALAEVVRVGRLVTAAKPGEPVVDLPPAHPVRGAAPAAPARARDGGARTTTRAAPTRAAARRAAPEPEPDEPAEPSAPRVSHADQLAQRRAERERAAARAKAQQLADRAAARVEEAGSALEEAEEEATEAEQALADARLAVADAQQAAEAAEAAATAAGEAREAALRERDEAEQAYADARDALEAFGHDGT